MESPDYQKAYNFAISKGITTIAANYFANKCCTFYYEAIKDDEEIMDNFFKNNFFGLPHEEIAFIKLESSIFISHFEQNSACSIYSSSLDIFKNFVKLFLINYF